MTRLRFVLEIHLGEAKDVLVQQAIIAPVSRLSQ
jgi:hypothetical protein